MMRSLLDQPGDPALVTYINLFSKKCQIPNKTIEVPESIPPSSHYSTPVPLIHNHQTHFVSNSKSNSTQKDICRFFANGHCYQGEDCIYSHLSPSPLLAPIPTIENLQTKLDVQQKRKKRKSEKQNNQICTHYLEGKCRYGESCYKIHLPGRGNFRPFNQ